jgi:RNA polymerase sigma factor (sigma-70 family)
MTSRSSAVSYRTDSRPPHQRSAATCAVTCDSSGQHASTSPSWLAVVSGDPQAWQQLVNQYSGLIRSVTLGFGLNEHDAADVMQTVWLQLAANVRQVRNPDRVAAWLATTTRHECVRMIRRRETSTDVAMLDAADQAADPVWTVVERDEKARLASALQRLPERDQRLLALLMAANRPGYSTIAAELGMPIGSIGPTRARALDRLRQELAACGVVGRAAA